MGISKNKTKKKSQKENNHFKGSRNTTGLSKGFSQIQIHEQGNTNRAHNLQKANQPFTFEHSTEQHYSRVPIKITVLADIVSNIAQQYYSVDSLHISPIQ